MPGVHHKINRTGDPGAIREKVSIELSQYVAAGYHHRYAACLSEIDKCHETRYIFPMIKTFTDKRTHELYTKGEAKNFAPDVASRAARKLEYIHLATQLDDLKVPPANRLHALSGEREGQYAISINDQWRICFRFVDGDAYEVEVCDYH
jgi:proteic killer suppression protein